MRSGEAKIAISLGLILMINSMALNISDVVAVSGFVGQVGTPQILILWLVDMGLILLTTSLQALVIDRYARLSLLRTMSLVIMAIYIVLRIMFTIGTPAWLNFSLLFLLAEQQALFIPLVFWVFANDVLELSQAKRLFPFIASWAFIGQMLGLGLAGLAPGLLQRLNIDASELLSLNVLLFLGAFVLMSGGLRNARVRETVHKSETALETLTEGWNFIREVASFRYLMIATLGIFVVLTILDFNFLVFADTTPQIAGDNFQRFYALYYLILTVVAFIIQLFVTSRLIERMELKNTFFITPITLLAGIAWTIALPRFIFIALAQAIGYLARDTISDPAGRAFQALVPEERRGRVSIFMDSYMYAGGTILGCAIIGVVLLIVGSPLQAFTIYLPIGAVFSIVAIWAVLRLRNVYETSLLNWRLKRRSRGASVLDDLEF